jgi:hypothetical protein
MSFGLLTTKWRILRAPMEGSLENISKAVEACARLHKNYYITEEHDESISVKAFKESIDPIDNDNIEGLGYWQCIPENGDLINITGRSDCREYIRESIMHNGYGTAQDI